MITASTAPPDFSVIVPIAVGRVPTVLASLDRLDADGVRCEVLAQVGPNPSRNRNQGIGRAHAAILAFTDDDCQVAPDWLTQAAAFFRAHPDYDAVGGPQLNLAHEGLVARASGYALASWFGTYRLRRRYRRGRRRLAATQLDLTSANLFVTRKAFDKWGPFDEHLWPNEESALIRRIEAGGGRIAYEPALVVFHKRRDTLAGFVRQCFGYGRGRVRQTRSERSWRASIEQAIPCAFLSYLAALPVLAWLSPLALAPLAVYAATNVGVSAATALARADAAAVLVMPLTLLVTHTAYPAGLVFEALCGLAAPAHPATTAAPAPSARRSVATS